MKQINQLIAPLLLLLLLVSACQKVPLAEPALVPASTKGSEEIKNLATAHTWQIEEVIDPFSGTRYKRGVTSDGKNFSIARYTYHADYTLTGMDWEGNNIENTTYTMLDNQKMKITSPACIYVNEVINISTSQFSYKTIDGSIIILGPVGTTSGSKK